MPSSLDRSFTDTARWGPEAARVRAILLDCGLSEAMKWGKPCYGHDGQNLAILQKMKDFLALMFFKGAVLADPAGVLQEQGENSRYQRRVCFTSVEQVDALEPTLRALVAEAIAAEAEGRALPERPELVLVEELQEALDADAALKEAFEALTPGRQREYHLFVSGAKQAKTRVSRVDQHRERILAGKGLRDR